MARRRRRKRDEQAKRGLVWWSTLIGLVAVVVGLVFTVWDRFGPEPEPPVRRAELGVAAVEAGLTFRQYLDRVDADPGGLDEDTLGRRGALLEFDVHAEGLDGAPLRLKWELLDGDTLDELGQEESTTITPGRDDETIAWHAFLPFPDGDTGPFHARIELLDEDGISLARLRSEPFAAS
jgi:hypothetical protein